MVVGGTLVTPLGYHRSWRAQIAAKYSGATVTVKDFVPGETDTDESFLAKFPPATVPVFEDQDGTCLFDANAIAFYLGTEQLRGGSNEHLVTQWVNFADSGILPSAATWVYPCLGVTQYNKQNTEKARAHIQNVLSFMDNYLRNVTYLVGDRLSQADITVFTALYLLFTHVCDENYRKHYPHVVRWYTTIANQPQVMEVVGKVDMCSKEASFDAKKYAELHKDGKPKTAKREDKKSHAKQEKSKPKPEEKPVEPQEEEQPKPSKNPFAELPAGTFDMDAFKRVYSNENIGEVAIPYFWDNFDPQTHSIWYCEYLYPEDLGRIFMSCNLIGGMFQRLERMLKYAFGSMCIFGDNSKSTISGLWIWRGTGLAFELSPDLQTDYESYSWRKLDPNDAETKVLVHDYFLQEFSDKPFNQAKIFK
ncbi:Eukaryotic translation elongation factor 1 gamma [Fasciola gigantica]|uniref:Eukaryotic translation elongation factor 1 gamma n=1 Tax=Fasciola gigantica TaxID=46835 RepID=A0A504YYF4_FASGI|nr:Eukaryotic translation elongation factor 1 gamma [Fasciola gigantica]